MLNTYNKSLLQSLCSRIKSKQCQRSLASPAASVSPRKAEKSPEVKRAPETLSFVMNLFRGRAILDQVFPYPLNLNDDRREMLQMVLSPTEKFLAEVNNPFENDEKSEISKDVLKQFAELGAFGAVVPEELEGAGLNNTQMARLAEVVGANDLGLGVVMGAHQSIGYKGILLFGSDELKRKYLPDLATGRKFAAFCLTEPSSGSDANSIQSQAVKSPDGKHYIINGSKIWISNGGFADVFTVFAQTPIKKPDGTTRNQVSAFVVERAFGGVTSGPPEKKMGIKGSNTAEVYFEDVKVPVENLLGQEGEGFKVAMNILNNGRFGIPAACTGAMKYCIQKTIDHVTTRVQFGKKLYEFGNVQEKVTDMIVRHYATESIVYMLASNMDAGVQDYQLEAAIGKVFASDNAWHVCDEAIQLHGGMGFMKECGLERVLRDLRIFRIFEGANDVMRLFVALTGAQFAGKHLQQLQKEIQSVNLSALFGELKRQVIPAVGADIGQVLHPSLKQHGTDVTKTIAAFGSTVDKLLKKHRKGIIDRQYELIRVANAAIDIYAMVAVLSRCSYTLNKSGNAPHEQKIAELFVKQASARAQENLRQAVNVGDDHIALISKIATDVFGHKAMIQQHPVDV